MNIAAIISDLMNANGYDAPILGEENDKAVMKIFLCLDSLIKKNKDSEATLEFLEGTIESLEEKIADLKKDLADEKELGGYPQ